MQKRAFLIAARCFVDRLAIKIHQEFLGDSIKTYMLHGSLLLKVARAIVIPIG
jgi:hypothetical protein